MSASERRGGPNPGKSRSTSRTTADANPSLAAAIQSAPAGAALDEHLRRALQRLGRTLPTRELSTSWEGMRRLVEHLTALGCYLETQIHADRCLCRVLRVLRGNAVAKQLAGAQASQLPEAVAKAALLACLEMEPPAE